MTLDLQVQLLQLAAAMVSIFVGRYWGGLSWKIAILSIALVLPCPILNPTGGAAGFVYASDVIGVACLVTLVLRKRPKINRPAGTLQALAICLLLVLPITSTALGGMNAGAWKWQFVALGVARSLSYLGVFLATLHYAHRLTKIRSILAIQIFFFCLICALGLLQFWGGIDLDYWNAVERIQVDPYGNGYGRGFMGLYRGAAGAWGATALGILPLIFRRPIFRTVLTTLIAVPIILAVLSVGSRQGLMIGFLSTCIGMALASSHVGRVKAVLTGCGTLICLGAIAFPLLQTGLAQDMRSFLTMRFGAVEWHGDQSLLSNIAQRDVNMVFVVDKVSGTSLLPAMVGVGYGRIVYASPSTYDLLYVDSELLWEVQEIGILGIGLYLAFLIALGRAYTRYARAAPLPAVGLCVLLTGCALAVGHYFILHVHSPQAPLAYWQWAILGGAAGASTRSRSAVQDSYRRRMPVSNIVSRSARNAEVERVTN